MVGGTCFVSLFVCLFLKNSTEAVLPESGFLFTEPKNELHEYTGSKQAKVFIIGKQIAPSIDSGSGRKSPPLYHPIAVSIP